MRDLFLFLDRKNFRTSKSGWGSQNQPVESRQNFECVISFELGAVKYSHVQISTLNFLSFQYMHDICMLLMLIFFSPAVCRYLSWQSSLDLKNNLSHFRIEGGWGILFVGIPYIKVMLLFSNSNQCKFLQRPFCYDARVSDTCVICASVSARRGVCVACANVIFRGHHTWFTLHNGGGWNILRWLTREGAH